MSASRTIFILNAAAVTALTVLILVFLNLASVNHFARVDLTDNDVYTLDPLSKEIAGRFQDTVTVKYYVTEDLFPPGLEFETLRQSVIDRLDEYVRNSNNRMVLKAVDPRDGKKDISKEIKDKLEAEGVVVSSHTVFKDEKPTPVEFYSSVKVNYVDKTRVVNDVADAAYLEYHFTKALKELLVFEIPEVGFYFSGEEKGFGQNGTFTSIQSILKKDYSVRAVDLKEDDPVPADIDILFVVAPEEVPERHKYEIDQFIMRGGRAVFLMEVFDPRKAQRQWMRGPGIFMKVQSGLDEMLAHYGVKVGSDILFDLDCPYREIPRQIIVEGIPIYKREKIKIPYIILSKHENYNKSLSFVNRLDNIGFIFASTLEQVQSPAGGADAKYSEVLASSNKGWKLEFSGPVMIETAIESQTLEPEKNQKEKNPEGRRYPIIALLEGRFKSFFASKEAPDPAAPKDPAEDQIKKDDAEKKKPKTVDQSPETRIIVMGDSGLFSDLALPYKPNVDLLENMLEWMSTEETLSKIRAKGFDPRPLDYNRGSKGLYMFVLVVGPTAFILLVGLSAFAVRRFERSVFIKAVAGARMHKGDEKTEPAPGKDAGAPEAGQKKE